MLIIYLSISKAMCAQVNPQKTTYCPHCRKLKYNQYPTCLDCYKRFYTCPQCNNKKDVKYPTCLDCYNRRQMASLPRTNPSWMSSVKPIAMPAVQQIVQAHNQIHNNQSNQIRPVISSVSQNTYNVNNTNMQKAMNILKPMITWLHGAPCIVGFKVQSCYENALTEWLGLSFWFEISEISAITGVAVYKINQIIFNQTGKQNESQLRFANSDTWTLQNDEMAPIMHSYLRVKLRHFL